MFFIHSSPCLIYHFFFFFHIKVYSVQQRFPIDNIQQKQYIQFLVFVLRESNIPSLPQFSSIQLVVCTICGFLMSIFNSENQQKLGKKKKKKKNWKQIRQATRRLSMEFCPCYHIICVCMGVHACVGMCACIQEMSQKKLVMTQQLNSESEFFFLVTWPWCAFISACHGDTMLVFFLIIYLFIYFGIKRSTWRRNGKITQNDATVKMRN